MLIEPLMTRTSTMFEVWPFAPVAVTVMLYVPPTEEVPAETLRESWVPEGEPTTGSVAKDAVTPAGRVDVVRVTLWTPPLTVMTVFTEAPPGITVTVLFWRVSVTDARKTEVTVPGPFTCTVVDADGAEASTRLGVSTVHLWNVYPSPGTELRAIELPAPTQVSDPDDGDVVPPEVGSEASVTWYWSM